MSRHITDDQKLKIKESLIATRERRKSQVVKVFELKVNCHQTSKETYNKFYSYFKQAKWITNDMLNFSKEGNDLFAYNYKDHRIVTRKTKEGDFVKEELDINTILHQKLVDKIKQDIKNLSKAKKSGLKVGSLKFKSEVNTIVIRTGDVKIKDNSHITIPGFKNLKVYGLKQLNKLSNYEIADGRLINKSSGIYIKITVCIQKQEKTYKGKSVGLDFGIKDNIITSDGEKFNCSVQESEHLKYLQKQLHKKVKGSKHYYKLRKQIGCEYEHLCNKKQDEANKTISYLKNNYDVIYFQDENLNGWKKAKRNKKNKKVGFSFGRQIQQSNMGRIKSKLKMLEKDDASFMISKWMPSTKYCPCCGRMNVLTLADRIYKCSCGYSEDRDIHAAKNVLMFGSTKRAECLEQASAETLSSIDDELIVKSTRQVDEAKTKVSSL